MQCSDFANRVIITGYNSVFLGLYNWLPYWMATLSRQVFFSSTMTLRALVLKMEHFSNTHSRTLVSVSASLGKVLSHLTLQCETRIFASQFLGF